MSSNRGPYTRQISGEEGELANARPLWRRGHSTSVRLLTQPPYVRWRTEHFLERAYSRGHECSEYEQ